MLNNINKSEILIETLPYIQKFYGKTIVVKYGGNAMINEELKNSVIEDIILMSCVGVKVVVVHGGGPEISNMLKRVGKESKFVNGLRVTDAETMEIVQMVLTGKINKDIVSLIDRSGRKAIGLSGIDGEMLKAKKKLQDGQDIGFVGEITKVNVDIVEDTLNDGYIPVVSTVALGEDDYNTYNINADYAASKIAAKLKAEKLILLTDVPGIMRDPSDDSTLMSELKPHDIHVLKMDGVIKGGMIPKVDCCVEAIREGVKRAHIIDGRVPHSILMEVFSDQGVGTMIY
ncbi:MAG: acetylglutamate kinase [Bacillota bacterium]|nr:acetylglutamate kinase [Bacillota bacterium]